MSFFRPPRTLRAAADAAAQLFGSMSARDHFGDPKFSAFMDGLPSRSWSENVKEYRRVTSADIPTATFAVLVAESLSRR